MTLQLVRCARCVMLMVLAWPEAGFRVVPPGGVALPSTYRGYARPQAVN